MASDFEAPRASSDQGTEAGHPLAHAEVERQAPSLLEEVFKTYSVLPSDINEHLPLLRELAAECEHVTEFGLRWASGSTIAFLAAQPAEFISWDIDPRAVSSPRVAELIGMAGRTKFQPRCGDTLKISPIETTDLLFIDTLHTSKQLWGELIRHVDPNHDWRTGVCRCAVKKYLIFHDTAPSAFGVRGEDGSTPGLRMAIRVFQKEHAFPLWELIEDRQNNNGLIVLKHV